MISLSRLLGDVVVGCFEMKAQACFGPKVGQHFGPGPLKEAHVMLWSSVAFLVWHEAASAYHDKVG